MAPLATSIRDLATRLTHSSSPCFFIHNTDTKPLVGGEYIVYALETPCAERLSIRIPRHPDPFAAHCLATEAEIRRLVDENKIDLFPSLIASSDSCENSLNSPYLALTWVDGQTLKWSDAYPTEEATRHKIIRAVANASIDLLRINKSRTYTHTSPMTTPISYSNVAAEGSSLDWIQSKIYRKIARCKAGTFPRGTVAECQKQMDLVKDYWIPDLDDAPHVLVHGDLSENNIIVREEYTVNGIIDFGWADFMPLQFAAAYPKFLTHEPSVGHDWASTGTEQMDKDRAFYLQCVRERAITAQDNSTLMAYYQTLARDDEIQRYWWITAASRVDIHEAMVASDWNPLTAGGRKKSE